MVVGSAAQAVAFPQHPREVALGRHLLSSSPVSSWAAAFAFPSDRILRSPPEGGLTSPILQMRLLRGGGSGNTPQAHGRGRTRLKADMLNLPPSRPLPKRAATRPRSCHGLPRGTRATGLAGLGMWELRPDSVDVQRPSSPRSSIPPQGCLRGLGKQRQCQAWGGGTGEAGKGLEAPLVLPGVAWKPEPVLTSPC